jgi:hypothetical protein
MENVLGNLSVLESEDRKFILFTHDSPLPDCRNELVARALAMGATKIWFVDDDIVPRVGWLNSAIALNQPVVAADYYMQTGTKAAGEQGDFKYAGFGCILINAEVFEQLEKPYFRTDIALIEQNGKYEWKKVKRDWGGEDVYFCKLLHDKGIPLTMLEDVKHLRTRNWGGKYLNNGTHEIYALDKDGEKK